MSQLHQTMEKSQWKFQKTLVDTEKLKVTDGDESAP